MPWTDLQFWIVSTFAVAALIQLVRPFMVQNNEPCAGCAMGKAACQSPRLVERIGNPSRGESRPTTP